MFQDPNKIRLSLILIFVSIMIGCKSVYQDEKKYIGLNKTELLSVLCMMSAEDITHLMAFEYPENLKGKRAMVINKNCDDILPTILFFARKWEWDNLEHRRHHFVFDENNIVINIKINSIPFK